MTDGLEAALSLTYAWIKAGHVIFVIFWIAGLFMLPRFYVYHQQAAAGSPEERSWIERERKLRKIIITPAMAMVWLLGLTLLYITGAWSQGWMQAKLVMVLLLSAYHGWMIGYGRKLAAGDRSMSGKALRIMNEVPGLATAVIVVLVIVKPF
ncbi:CopD family protein [Sphingosinicella rhizophila]|uniref:Protoporphyrinogen IX oxidase n=1 Tax=Sphingosinicella rhizophila TaxID=3050082 RepID=A0ABU3Q8X3_9SPHN|nr:CopD family protein [Sphingosinicella sp. GR2756]MDT9599554.1 CopD family protein [Sphingosinicella sp. GR2756]